MFQVYLHVTITIINFCKCIYCTLADDGESTDVVQFATPQTNPEYFAQSPLSAKSAVSYMKQRPIAKPVPLPTIPPTMQNSIDVTKQSPHYDNSTAAYQQPRLHSFRRM